MTTNSSELVVLSKNPAIVLELRSIFEPQGFRVRTVLSDKEAVEAVRSFSDDVAGAIVDTSSLESKGDSFVKELKSGKASFPVAIIAEQEIRDAMVKLMLYENLAVLKRPFKIDLAKKTIWKMIRQSADYAGPENRKFRRVSTDFVATLGPYGDGVVKNISGGGLLVNSPTPIRVGSILFLRIPQFYSIPIPAKVVWSEENMKDRGETANIGFQFTSPNAQTLSMISKFVYEKMKGTDFLPY